MFNWPFVFKITLYISFCISAPLLAGTKVNTFRDNGNGSVTDAATGLIWQQQNDDISRTHAEAIGYCQGLTLAGNSNWRLPNIKELVTIVDHRNNSPSIDAAIFPNTEFFFYWSVSTQASNPSTGFTVWFIDGVVTPAGLTGQFLTRCVR